MRCRLVRAFRFESAHFLPKVPEGHKCARTHGHSYEVELTIEGDVDPNLGWVRDFSVLSEHIGPLITQVDHRLLNDIEGLDNPTTEVFVKWFWDRLKKGLPDLVEIAISETPTTRCIYRGE